MSLEEKGSNRRKGEEEEPVGYSAQHYPFLRLRATCTHEICQKINYLHVTKTLDQQENRTPNLQIWNLTRYQLRQPATVITTGGAYNAERRRRLSHSNKGV